MQTVSQRKLPAMSSLLSISASLPFLSVVGGVKQVLWNTLVGYGKHDDTYIP